MTDNLTRVEVVKRTNIVRHSIRFGHHIYRQKIDSDKEVYYYEPDHLVGYVRWHMGKHGSKYWRVLIFMTSSSKAQKQMQQIPGVKPGVMLLLDLEGVSRVRKLFSVFNHIERLGLHLADISPAYYGMLHQRILSSSPYHFYTKEQHQSYLKEKGIIQ